ncbi:LacI family DNA-binding transcriptional regulator [Curtobacterium sp. MCSS17_015]|uniref:LacI family DNA-binding transcriptional regulator n=1 Tax=Curtobacterium sp. MCSS17_015 TaxID=2175666 RepID=UPI0015E878D5|nr:LacI family DNA-binding transcriptional regulator [Curtobacterium sp. MCSS17_015]WIB26719.1 LacI family DNA-binding transcriptional regulator [Curtobacterium sp. MCSS17_015]
MTLADVARHAGVSRAAASLVVRDEGRLSEATRNRVRASMHELGYVYHRGAASLRMQNTSTFGLIVTDLTNPFFAEMTVGFEERLERDDLLAFVTNTFDRPGRQEALVRSMIERGVDALVVVPVQTEAGTATIDAGGLPVLAVTRRPEDGIAYLGPDDRVGGHLAARHLIDHGHRRLVYLGGPRHGSARKERIAAVREELAAAGGTLVADLDGRTSLGTGRDAGRVLLDSGVSFDAVICHSDEIAFGFAAALRTAGRAPASVPMVGFDGLAAGAVMDPPLTSVSVGPGRLGAYAVDVLTGLRAGAEPTTELLTPQLLVRSSCGCADDQDP